MPELRKLLFRVPEAAEVLSMGRSRVYELITRGELRSVKVGASRLVPADALVEYAASLSADTPKPAA